MTHVGPGDASFQESMAKIAQIMRETQAEVGDIRQMSEVSFRSFLDQVVQRAAERLGIALAAAAALIADMAKIVHRAADSFRQGYRKAYDERRQIR
jgi:hypothetical protein